LLSAALASGRKSRGLVPERVNGTCGQGDSDGSVTLRGRQGGTQEN